MQNLKIGIPFIELQQVDSTNNYATALVRAGMAQSGTVVLAHEQTKGRGQRSKSWNTKGSGNITMSVLITPDRGLEKMFLFSMAVAAGVHRFFNNHVPDDVTIKWPNDLYWRDRKAGGILIENIIQNGEWKYSVVGIGININQTDFAAIVTKAVSLKQITGRDYDVLLLAKELCGHLEWGIGLLMRHEEAVVHYYHQHLFMKDAEVRLKKENRVFSTIVKGVNASGELITNNGIEALFSVGEVEWLL
ncbi:MAG: biotin--[acetyl-CoA-carboxylase] ligase [Chitinophagaceae bacterium]